jgi:hypothetical protein
MSDTYVTHVCRLSWRVLSLEREREREREKERKR